MAIKNRNAIVKDIIKSRETLQPILIVEKPLITDKRCDVHIKEIIGESNIELDLWFEWDEGSITFTHDQLANIIAWACEKKYTVIKMDLIISKHTFDNVSRITQAKLTVQDIMPDIHNKYANRKNFGINVSGGMDSVIAAKMFSESIPFTVDFSSRTGTDSGFYYRESEYVVAKELNPKITRTNIDQFPWLDTQRGFNNISSIIHADKYELTFTTGGKFLTCEGALAIKKIWSSQPDYRYPKLCYIPIVYGASYAPIMIGMTLFKGYKVLYSIDPIIYNKVMDQRITCTISGSVIRRILVDIITTGKVRVPEIPQKKILKWEQWNRLLENKLISYYVLKHIEVDIINKYIVDIPQADIDFVKNLSLEFYEKYDQKFLDGFPDYIREYVVKKLEEHNVEFYSDNDYIERDIVFENIFNTPYASQYV